MKDTELIQIVTHQENQLKKLNKLVSKLLNSLYNKNIEEILKLLNEYYIKIDKEINNYFFWVYEDVNLKFHYNTQITNKVKYPISKIDKENIMKTITESFLDATYKQRLEKHKNQLKERLKQIDKIDSTEISKNQQIKRAIDVANSKLTRLIITEGTRVINVAIIDAAKEIPFITKLIYVAILDDKTSEICTKLNNTIINKSDIVQGVNAPPMHCYCRSSLKDLDDLDQQNRLKEMMANGEIEYMDINMSYKAWYDEIISKIKK